MAYPNDSQIIGVLVIEDDDAVRGVLVAMIEADEGLEVSGTAGNAADAIRVAADLRPDVALVDVGMPGGGINAARGIQSSSPTTRVLALSGNGDRATVVEMLEVGAVGYLVKGEPMERIVSSIRAAAHGQGTLSSGVTGPVIDELRGQRALARRAERSAQLPRSRIAHALEEPDAFAIVYQPICALETGEVVGFEALARFAAPPQRTPDRWFAEAAQVGRLLELELATVGRAIAGLDALPAGTYLGLNVSPATVCSSELAELLRTADARRLVLEVTEHARIDDYARLNASLRCLRTCGIRLAIDDAGAGFASLRHILRLEPELIKLDLTLIQGIADDRSLQALAAGLISFAGRIDATIIAEGIERPSEVEALLELGVAYGQGFFLGRPGALPLASSAR